MNPEEVEIEVTGLHWNKPHFYLDEKIFIPKIYDLRFGDEPDLSSYNTVLLHLNGKVSADLDWKAEEQAAQNYSDQGLKLLWQLDLGLFNCLKAPLSNQMQFLSLILSLEHFRDTLWKKFKDCTLGVCLYEGSANFAKQIVWDDQLQANFLLWSEKHQFKFEDMQTDLKSLFARDAVAEYLTLMANRMPDAMQFFIQLEVEPLISLAKEAQLLNRERFERFHLMARGGRLPMQYNDEAKIGVCLPGCHLIDPKLYQNLEEVFGKLLIEKTLFRIIPEAFLTHEWDGLDYLIVEPAALSSQGKRKLLGFCAAGGTIVTLGEQLLGLPHEIKCKAYKG